LDEFIWIFPLKKSSFNILSSNANNTLLYLYCSFMFFPHFFNVRMWTLHRWLKMFMEYHDFILNHPPFLDVVTKFRHCQEVQVTSHNRSIPQQNFVHLQTMRKLHHVNLLQTHKEINLNFPIGCGLEGSLPYSSNIYPYSHNNKISFHSL